MSLWGWAVRSLIYVLSDHVLLPEVQDVLALGSFSSARPLLLLWISCLVGRYCSMQGMHAMCISDIFPTSVPNSTFQYYENQWFNKDTTNIEFCSCVCIMFISCYCNSANIFKCLLKKYMSANDFLWSQSSF